MASSLKQLENLVHELEAHLRGVSQEDEQVRLHVQRAAEELRLALDRCQTGQPIQTASELQGDLKSLVERFEASHPNLTAILVRVIDALAQLGI
jgi:DNA repair ATPase RecN